MDEQKMKCAGKAIIVVSVAIIALGVIFGWIGSMRKYDYAVMFSENAVATLQEIKTGKWEVVNARWAMDARGAWNYEFIVRRPAPFISFGRKKAEQQAAAQQAAAQRAAAQKAAQQKAAPAAAPQAAPAPAPKAAEPAPAPAEAPKQ